MKTRCIINIVFGTFLLFLDVAVTLNIAIGNQFKDTTSSYGIGVVIGSQFCLYIGLLFFYGSYRISRKLKEKRQRAEWETNINKIGED